MPKMKLTALAVERLTPPTTGRLEFFDLTLPGFGLRITDKGAKSWIAMYRVGGRGAKVRRLTLGTYPALTLADARAAASEAFRQVAQGIDPAEVRNERREAAAERRANTVGAMVGEFLHRHAEKKNRASTVRAVTQVFRADVLPRWGDRPIDGIGRKDVLALLDGIMDRGADYQANRTLAHVRKLFNWCMERGILEANPAAGIKAPGKEQSRDRILADGEVVALWAAFRGLAYPFGPMFRLLLLTGQRREEVAAMRREEVNLTKRLWTLPADKTKAGRVHEVPLSDMAAEIIADLPNLVGGPFLFSTTGGDRPPSGFSRAKARADQAVAHLGHEVAPWRLHDLRRTVASGMARLGVAPQVLARILNHAPGSTQGVTAVYNRHGYDAEKRHALDLWARHVADLVEPAPDNVVQLRKRERAGEH